MRQLIKDFRDFIGHGSAIDLAVGVILGSAIGTILKSFVDELIIPITGLLGRVDFSNQYLVLRGTVADGTPLGEARKVAGVVILGYGQFLTVLINTMVLAAAIFLVVRARARFMRQAAATPPPPNAEIVLLTEIRDAVRQAAQK